MPSSSSQQKTGKSPPASSSNASRENTNHGGTSSSAGKTPKTPSTVASHGRKGGGGDGHPQQRRKASLNKKNESESLSEDEVRRTTTTTATTIPPAASTTTTVSSLSVAGGGGGAGSIGEDVASGDLKNELHSKQGEGSSEKDGVDLSTLPQDLRGRDSSSCEESLKETKLPQELPQDHLESSSLSTALLDTTSRSSSTLSFYERMTSNLRERATNALEISDKRWQEKDADFDSRVKEESLHAREELKDRQEKLNELQEVLEERLKQQIRWREKQRSRLQLYQEYLQREQQALSAGEGGEGGGDMTGRGEERPLLEGNGDNTTKKDNNTKSGVSSSTLMLTRGIKKGKKSPLGASGNPITTTTTPAGIVAGGGGQGVGVFSPSRETANTTEKKAVGKAATIVGGVGGGGKGNKKKGVEEDEKEKKNTSHASAGRLMRIASTVDGNEEVIGGVAGGGGYEEDLRGGLYEGMTPTDFFCLDDEDAEEEEEDNEDTQEEEQGEEGEQQNGEKEKKHLKETDSDKTTREGALKKKKKKKEYDEASTKKALDENIHEAQSIIKDMRNILFHLITSLEDIEIQRKNEATEQLRELSRQLKNIAYHSQGEVERIIQDKCKDINMKLLHHKHAHARVVGKLSEAIDAWERQHTKASERCLEELKIHSHYTFIRSAAQMFRKDEEFTKPAEKENLRQLMEEKERNLNLKRHDIIHEALSCPPSSINPDRITRWKTRLSRVQEETSLLLGNLTGDFLDLKDIQTRRCDNLIQNCGRKLEELDARILWGNCETAMEVTQQLLQPLKEKHLETIHMELETLAKQLQARQRAGHDVGYRILIFLEQLAVFLSSFRDTHQSLSADHRRTVKELTEAFLSHNKAQEEVISSLKSEMAQSPAIEALDKVKKRIDAELGNLQTLVRTHVKKIGCFCNELVPSIQERRVHEIKKLESIWRLQALTETQRTRVVEELRLRKLQQQEIEEEEDDGDEDQQEGEEEEGGRGRKGGKGKGGEREEDFSSCSTPSHARGGGRISREKSQQDQGTAQGRKRGAKGKEEGGLGGREEGDEEEEEGRRHLLLSQQQEDEKHRKGKERDAKSRGLSPSTRKTAVGGNSSGPGGIGLTSSSSGGKNASATSSKSPGGGGGRGVTTPQGGKKVGASSGNSSTNTSSNNNTGLGGKKKGGGEGKGMNNKGDGGGGGKDDGSSSDEDVDIDHFTYWSDSGGTMYKELKKSFEDLLASLSLPRPSSSCSSASPTTRLSISTVKSLPEAGNLSPVSSSLSISQDSEEISHFSNPLLNDPKRERKGTIPNSSSASSMSSSAAVSTSTTSPMGAPPGGGGDPASSTSLGIRSNLSASSSSIRTSSSNKNNTGGGVGSLVARRGGGVAGSRHGSLAGSGGGGGVGCLPSGDSHHGGGGEQEGENGEIGEGGAHPESYAHKLELTESWRESLLRLRDSSFNFVAKATDELEISTKSLGESTYASAICEMKTVLARFDPTSSTVAAISFTYKQRQQQLAANLARMDRFLQSFAQAVASQQEALTQTEEELRGLVQELESQQDRAQQLSLDDLQVPTTTSANASSPSSSSLPSPSALSPSTGLETLPKEKTSIPPHAPPGTTTPSSSNRTNPPRSPPSALHTPHASPSSHPPVALEEIAPTDGAATRTLDLSLCLSSCLDESNTTSGGVGGGGGGGLTNEGLLEGRIGGILMQRLERRRKQFLHNQERLRKEAEKKLQCIEQTLESGLHKLQLKIQSFFLTTHPSAPGSRGVPSSAVESEKEEESLRKKEEWTEELEKRREEWESQVATWKVKLEEIASEGRKRMEDQFAFLNDRIAKLYGLGRQHGAPKRAAVAALQQLQQQYAVALQRCFHCFAMATEQARSGQIGFNSALCTSAIYGPGTYRSPTYHPDILAWSPSATVVAHFEQPAKVSVPSLLPFSSGLGEVPACSKEKAFGRGGTDTGTAAIFSQQPPQEGGSNGDTSAALILKQTFLPLENLKPHEREMLSLSHHVRKSIQQRNARRLLSPTTTSSSSAPPAAGLAKQIGNLRRAIASPRPASPAPTSNTLSQTMEKDIPVSNAQEIRGGYALAAAAVLALCAKLQCLTPSQVSFVQDGAQQLLESLALLQDLALPTEWTSKEAPILAMGGTSKQKESQNDKKRPGVSPQGAANPPSGKLTGQVAGGAGAGDDADADLAGETKTTVETAARNSMLQHLLGSLKTLPQSYAAAAEEIEKNFRAKAAAVFGPSGTAQTPSTKGSAGNDSSPAGSKDKDTPVYVEPFAQYVRRQADANRQKLVAGLRNLCKIVREDFFPIAVRGVFLDVTQTLQIQLENLRIHLGSEKGSESGPRSTDVELLRKLRRQWQTNLAELDDQLKTLDGTERLQDLCSSEAKRSEQVLELLSRASEQTALQLNSASVFITNSCIGHFEFLVTVLDRVPQFFDFQSLEGDIPFSFFSMPRRSLKRRLRQNSSFLYRKVNCLPPASVQAPAPDSKQHAGSAGGGGQQSTNAVGGSFFSTPPAAPAQAEGYNYYSKLWRGLPSQPWTLDAAYGNIMSEKDQDKWAAPPLPPLRPPKAASQADARPSSASSEQTMEKGDKLAQRRLIGRGGAAPSSAERVDEQPEQPAGFSRTINSFTSVVHKQLFKVRNASYVSSLGEIRKASTEVREQLKTLYQEELKNRRLWARKLEQLDRLREEVLQ